MKTITTAAIAAMMFAAGANAEFINVQFTGTGQGKSVRVSNFGNQMDVFAGQLKHTLSGGTGDAAAFNGNYLTFCSDLYQFVTSSTKTYEIVPIDQIPGASPMGLPRAWAVQSLFDGFGNQALASNADSNLAAAFQIAVWEIVTDYSGSAASMDITAGNFTAKKTNNNALDPAMGAHLSNMFAAAMMPATNSIVLGGLSSGKYQDQIVAGLSVPAPGPVALAGVAGLLACRRKR